MPSDEVVSKAIENSPEGLAVVVIAIIAIVFVVARYIVPSWERTRMRKLDIEQQKATTDAERVKANAMLAESNRQTNTLIEGMRRSLDASTAHTDVLVAELRSSRDRSKEMGGAVDLIKQTTSHTDTLVEDIHRHIIGGEGTD